ncbi:MAG: hypothetical protein OEZ59_13350 [Deltaproteobacteria bacterium]|nr:hypothetical protein [Deltaproteobacteria bacterium]
MTIRQIITAVITLALALPALAPRAQGIVPERRDSKGNEELGWLIAPAPIKVEGIGEAVPVFALLSNFYETTDLTSGYTLPGGDIEARFIFIRDFPLLTRHIMLSAARFHAKMPFRLFNRGIDSDPEDYVQRLVRYNGGDFKVRLNFWKERIEFFHQESNIENTTLAIYDKDGNLLSNNPTTDSYLSRVYGVQLDLTDDPLDPRRGVHVGRKILPRKSEFDIISDTQTVDTSLSLYFPMFGKDTLVFNAFRSRSTITRSGVTDEATARIIMDQGCDIAQPSYDACKAAEDKLVGEFLAYNRHGLATPLGGESRLRAYPLARFSAGNSSFYGLEYRLNFADRPVDINLLMLGGVRTLLQMAFFYEQGTVNDDAGKLGTGMKPSYGIGFRALISGFIYRMDIARGEEGSSVNVLFDYPMKLTPMTE